MSTSTTMQTTATTGSDPVRDKNWLLKKQILIWLPQGISILVFWVLLPCYHPFPGSEKSWRNLIPTIFDFSTIASVSATPFVVNSVMYLSLFATVIVIFVGTLQFLMEAQSTRKNDAYARWAYKLTLLSLGFVAVWGISILTTDKRLWIIEKWGIELWSLAIFLLFGAIDVLYWISFRYELKSRPGDRSTEMKKDFSANSFWFIDAPVIIGVISVWLVTLYITRESGLHELTETGKNLFTQNGRVLTPYQQDQFFESFLHGFSTGAIIMHIAFSQFIFGMLKTRDLRQRSKKGLAYDLYV
jgi:hypothetical protein